MNDTVFALSTPVGGAITIMRISGPDSRALLQMFFTGRIEHRRVSYGRIVDDKGETVDHCTAVFFSAPYSYTGEDMAEIFTHGSYAVAKRLTEMLAASGLAVQAEPGEFTKRAYLNGKMDLAQAEAVMDLISSTAERQRRAAQLQLEGRLSAMIGGIYDRVKASCALLSAAMDDDTDEIEYDEHAASAETALIKADIDRMIEGGMRAKVLREGARIAIIGSPNVGKSSLLNALICRERSIVTNIPGTTRDTVEESADIDGIPVVFIDTAGIHETSDTVEKLGIERSEREKENADMVLLLIDGSRSISEEDCAIIKGLDTQQNRKILVLITKSDLPQLVEADAEALCGLDAIRISSLTGEGMTGLKKRIAAAIAPDERDPALTNTRHIALLEQAAKRLGAASEMLKNGETDIAFLEMRAAMDDIAAVTGREDPSEDLINSVFAGFCVGK
ncbi:MAG: tRNA uridine-5-carboxymethylaminomethyl(34) synthesis GTPase MnmE [Clostridia bacterium]|nr:tRNA uridine-5-carboxymethylaminomethyl(34) synthesis GTPase MnmE [Clostridia bacterium]